MSTLDSTPPESQSAPVDPHSLEIPSISTTQIAPPQSTYVDATPEAPQYASAPLPSPPVPKRNPWFRMLSIAASLVFLVVLILLFILQSHKNNAASQANNQLHLKTQLIPLPQLSQELSTPLRGINTLTINGQLAVSNTLSLQPSTKPSSTTAGELYYDQATNLLGYYNGTAFVYLQGGGSVINNITNNSTVIGGATNNTFVSGGGLSGQGTINTLTMFTSSGSIGNSLLSQNGSVVTINGSTLVKGSNSLTALQVQNASGTAIFTTDTTNSAIVLGSDGSSPTTATLRGGAAIGANASGVNLTIQGSNGTGSANGGDIILETGQSPQGGIQFDSAAHASSSGSTVSTNFTVGTKKDRILFVTTDWATTSLTYDGRPLTAIASISSAQHFGGGAFVELWYLLNPPSGTFTLTAAAGGGGTAFGAVAYSGVNQTNPFNTPVTATSSSFGSTPSSMAVSTSNSSQIVVDGFSADKDGSSQVCSPISGGQTTRWTVVQQFFPVNCGSDIVGNGGNITISWAATNVDWSDVGVALNPSVPGSTPLQIIGGSTPDTLSDRLHITATGNIGIDNANPQYALDVNGVINASTSVYSPILDTVAPGTLTLGNLNASSIQIGNTSTNIPTSILGTVIVKPTPGNNSSTDFQIQNASNTPLLLADTTNTVITVAGSGSTVATLNLSNARLESTQTTAPTSGTPANCGTSPTSAVTAGSTDTAGSISITTGSGSPTTCDTAITFNKPYGSTPKSIIVTPTTSVGGATASANIRVSSAGATSLTLQIAPNNPVASTTYSFYYVVIE